jgi:predicted O-linked N-acetylglucosamine transferase (SPINDLY family)
MNQLPVDQLLEQAKSLLDQGQINPALRRLQDVVQREPGVPRYWSAFAAALRRADRLDEAVACLLKAAALEPDGISCRTQLATLLAGQSRIEESIHWHAEALQRQPDSVILQLNHLFVLPSVARSVAEIEACRQRCFEGMPALLGDPDLRLYSGHEYGSHTFRLAYHGRNDRALLESYGDLLGGFSGEYSGPVLEPLATGTKSFRRYRVGFLSAFFYDHSNARAFEGLIDGLDRDRFELVLLPLEGTPSDPLRTALEGSCDTVVTVPCPLDAAMHCLRSLKLDLLFFTDVGIHPVITALVTRRHAPVQVTGWGIPHTSGFASIDYYISADLVEPAGAQGHYREKLVLLPGLPCRYLSSSLPMPPENLPRIRPYFMLPEEGKVLGCLQDFMKLHPDFDAVLEAIARRLPDALFVVVEPKLPELAQIFLDRIAVSAPTLAERLLLLARMSRSEYMGLAGCLDLMLDPIHYGGGVTIFETLATGTPAIGLEGPLLRSRVLAGAYRQMGLADAPIATSLEGYVELAVTLMQDDERRLALRERIRLAARQHLYDRMEMVHGFEDFAVEAITRARFRA